MNGILNGIIIDGKVYEAVKGKCSECAFHGCLELAAICALRDDLECAFRFSQTLTDKIKSNEKEINKGTVSPSH